MAKSTRPSIKSELIMAVVAGSGLRVEEKASWLKVGFEHARLYVNKGESVREVHLSGDWAECLKGEAGTIVCPPNGSVKCHLDLSHPDALGYLERALEMIAMAPRPVKAHRAPRVTEGPKSALAEVVRTLDGDGGEVLSPKVAARVESIRKMQEARRVERKSVTLEDVMAACALEEGE